MSGDKNKPASVLFVCTMNAVRSPIAAALLHHLRGKDIYVQSAGVDAGALDPMAVDVMAEIGIAMAHNPQRFEDLQDDCFDLVVALSHEAETHALEWSRTVSASVEYWITTDPTLVEGSPEQRRAAYRAVRDTLKRQIAARFT